MLGCQDFCGYYEWTFHFVRRNWGQAGIELLWRDAIGGESQRHYADAAAQDALRGLYRTWVGTGQDEKCDWTFTLDEEKNVLRWDMRECPSKGFLIRHDLAADEDYCNHCMGWIIPMLEGIGAEIDEHEHNHCGQCWATIRMKDRPTRPLHLDVDVRDDPRWRRGYLDRWAHNQPVPAEQIETLRPAPLVTDATYNDPQQCPSEPVAVLIGCPPADLAVTAARYDATPPARRPLLLHAFLPAVPAVDFLAANLPRPLPILPLLIRTNQYTHRPGGPPPTTEQFVALVAAALGKPTK
jgi:hypothetical protein